MWVKAAGGMMYEVFADMPMQYACNALEDACVHSIWVRMRADFGSRVRARVRVSSLDWSPETK